MRKKLLSLVLALAVSLSLCLPAMAAEFDDNSFYGSQLTGKALEMYNYAVSNLDVLGRPDAEITYHLELSGNDEADSYLEQSTLTDLANALSWDHPEFFWTTGVTVSWYTEDWITYTITVVPRTGRSWTDGGRSLESDRAFVANRVREIAAGARSAGNTRYEQLLYAHNWLIRNNRYNMAAAEHSEYMSDYYDTTPWRPISALATDLSPVCEAYSRAFKLICEELGVPCILVTGDSNGAHMWNYVQMENGLWYGVDVTYDDPVDDDQERQPLLSGLEEQYYFLVGDAGKFAGRTLERPWSYPALAPADYQPPQASEEPAQTEEPANVAYASTQTVDVGGRPVEFQMYALRGENGGLTNYIKLRDLADALDGTDAQFNVGWDNNGVLIETAVPYASRNGQEHNTPYSGDQTYTVNTSPIRVNWIEMDLDSFVITWNGGGSTYFKLRDLGQALGFNVGWSAERGVFIQPDMPFNPND